jgi:chromosome segregation protein
VQLSQGTRDQLLLALRLAVLDLLAQEVPLPLVLDDPFAHWDERRLARAREMLRALARERQVVLLSHRREFAAWGEPVTSAEAPARG